MANTLNDGRNLECYARTLGECCGEISREHYVSDCVLKHVHERFGQTSETVFAMNLAFLKPDEAKKLTIGRLADQILCKRHNNQLNLFDTEGKAMFIAMDRIVECGLNPRLPAASARIDGDKLERWMLKTLCGAVYSGKFRLLDGVSKIGVCPPVDWLKVLFANAALNKPLGLYYINQANDEMILSDQNVLMFMPLMLNNPHEIVGLRVWLFGFEFALLAEPLPRNIVTMFDHADYRPGGLRLEGSNNFIVFDWKNGSGSPAINFRSHAAKPE